MIEKGSLWKDIIVSKHSFKMGEWVPKSKGHEAGKDHWQSIFNVCSIDERWDKINLGNGSKMFWKGVWVVD